MRKLAPILILTLAALAAWALDTEEAREAAVVEFEASGLAQTNRVQGSDTLKLRRYSYSGPNGTGLVVRAVWVRAGVTNGLRVKNTGPETYREKGWAP